MESFAKVVLILTVFLGVLSMDVNGGRTLKGNEEVVDHPQTFGSLPTFPSPGFGGPTFPSPGFGGTTFPSPGFGGSFPSPGLGGSFPTPSLGSGPSTFCSFPGVQCPPAQPNIPSGSNGGAASVSGSP